MREIKFRAWDVNAKMMRDDGKYPKGKPHMKYDVGILASRAKNEWATGVDGLEIRLDSKDFIVMQFTGLLDKNGKEIYEGDILSVSNMEFSHFQDSGIPDSPSEIFIDIKGTVSFTKGQFEVDGHSLGEIPLSVIDSIEIEIIGNIHENPELL